MPHLYSGIWFCLKIPVAFYQLYKGETFKRKIQSVSQETWRQRIWWGTVEVCRSFLHKCPAQVVYHHSAKPWLFHIKEWSFLCCQNDTVLIDKSCLLNTTAECCPHTLQVPKGKMGLTTELEHRSSEYKIGASTCSSESAAFGELNAFEEATATSCASLRWIYI